jgi:hypothetical protein
VAVGNQLTHRLRTHQSETTGNQNIFGHFPPMRGVHSKRNDILLYRE